MALQGRSHLLKGLCQVTDLGSPGTAVMGYRYNGA
jgi:hypothetical protein